MPLRHICLPLTMAIAMLITVILGFRFYLMLYYPATEETQWLFEFMLPRWSAFDTVTTVLSAPGSMLAQLAGLTHVPSADFMAQWSALSADELRSQYPGLLEWESLLSIPIWNGLLLGLSWCVLYLVDHRDVITPGRRRDTSGAGAAALPKRTRSQNPPPARAVGAPLPPESPDGGSSDPQYKSRLAQIKTNPGSAPQIKRDQPPKTRETWDEYKKREGDLMVRHMIQELRQENSQLQAEQQQLRSTFSQYFSPNVLRYLEDNRADFQRVENQQRDVSILFCDIRGFSTYSQTAAPDDLVAFLDEYFNIASHIILHQYDGVISKLMGDGLMAYWGFPIPQPDHAYVATRAALDILKEVDLRNHTTQHATPMNIGIGIASGPAIVGNIGSADFKDFTLLGNPVNLAARLEEANKSLNTQLLISANTYAGLQGRIPCEDRGEHAVRGLQGAERIYAPHRG